MKLTYLWLIVVVMCISACSTAPTLYHYETLYPDTRHVKFKFISTQEKNGDTVIHGALFHKPKSPVRESGHIDIAVYNLDGKLIRETTANYKTPINGNYEWSKVGVNFLAPLHMTPPPGSLIKFAFHVDKEWKTTPAEHGVNVAR